MKDYKVFWDVFGTVIDSIGRAMRKRIDWEKIINRTWEYFEIYLPRNWGRGRGTKALVSHFQGGEDVSLMPLLHGKVLVIKDFAPILAKRREDREMVFAALRSAYDGESSRASGTGQTEHIARFGCLAGSTKSIENIGTFDASLGERFCQFKLITDDPANVTRWVIDNFENSRRWRADRKEKSAVFFDNLGKIKSPSVTPEERERILKLSLAACAMRTPVPRDWRGHNVVAVPETEVPTRFALQLTKLYKAIKLITDSQLDAIRACTRVAAGSVTDARLIILKAIMEGQKTRQAIQMMSGLSEWLTRVCTEDLAAVRVLKCNKGFGMNATVYDIAEEFRKPVYAFVKYRGLPEFAQ